MSAVKGADDELAGLKVSELKKLCKMNNLPTTGTKTELMGRILENKAVGNSFSALPPEEEARLLGDDDCLVEGVKVSGGQPSPPSCTSGAMTNTDDDAALDDLATMQSPRLAQAKSTNPLTTTTSTADNDRNDGVTPTKADNLSSVPTPVASASTDGVDRSDQVEKSTAYILDDDDDDEGPTEVKLRAVPSDDERLALRASRFGLPRTPHPMGDALNNEKLAARAKRFGLPIGDVSGAAAGTTNPTSKLSDTERLKRRAERFGACSNASPNSTVGNPQQSEEERKVLRLQRFGGGTDSSKNSTETEDEQRKAARAVKFGLVTSPTNNGSTAASSVTETAEKLSKRAARFGLVG